MLDITDIIVNVSACFSTTGMFPRNQTHDDGVDHAWFIFTCTQNLVYIYRKHNQSLPEPLMKEEGNPNLLGKAVSCSWWRIPIHSDPLPVCNCPLPFDSNPLHPFPTPSARITLHYNDMNHLGLLCPGHYLC